MYMLLPTAKFCTMNTFSNHRKKKGRKRRSKVN
jgi:hypothetical protein